MVRKLKLAERKFIEEKIISSRNQLICRAVIENNTTKSSIQIQTEIKKFLSKDRAIALNPTKRL
jgi:hypothetical protein